MFFIFSFFFFFFSSRRRHTRWNCDWSSDVCSSDLEGELADVVAIAAAYADWLAKSDVPKLWVKAEPGGILASDALVDSVRKWPAQAEVTVAGVHFVQEDSPDEIGRAVADWMGASSRKTPRFAKMSANS